jgi:hypothetical protein
MKRIATIAVLAVAVAAPAAGSLSAASAKSSGATVVRSEREVRIVGTITKLNAKKVTVANSNRKVTFVIPAGFNVQNQKGDRVEAEGRKVGGKLTLTSLHSEDRAAAAAKVSYYGARGDDHGHHGGGHGGHGNDDGPNHR